MDYHNDAIHPSRLEWVHSLIPMQLYVHEPGWHESAKIDHSLACPYKLSKPNNHFR